MSSIACRALILLTVLAAAPFAAAEPGKEPVAGAAPAMRSAGQLTFGPGGVLFVADSAGAAVWALELGAGGKPAGGELPRIEEIDAKVAALLGTAADDVLIHDLAVHPASHEIYLSVSRGRGDDAVPVIVRVDGTGVLSVVDLSKVPTARASIDNVPAPDATDRRGRPLRRLAITDLAFSGGHLYVAGLSNEEFSSGLRKLPYPFTGEAAATSVEIFHGAHGQFETHAPIRTLMPYEQGGEAHLLAAYTCTPLVTFPVAALEPGKHLKAKTIAELGFGNTPLDMIQFTKDGEPYVLILNSSRGGMRIRAADIDKAEAIVTHDHITRETPTAGVPYLTVPMGGVLRADNYDDDSLVVLRRNLETGSLELRLWTKAWI